MKFNSKFSFVLSILISVLMQSVEVSAQSVFNKQRVIVIMMDGFGEKYYRSANMPFLNEMEQKGIYKVVPSLMPAVTNVNNMSIAAGNTPAQNGITGNVFYNSKKQKEEYIEDPELMLTPSIFQKAQQLGIKTALLSVKQKTVDVLGKYADYTLCPECVAVNKNKWANVPVLGDVYSTDVNYKLLDAADSLLKARPEVKLMFIHTTDYPMHMWPPEGDTVKTFLNTLDAHIAKLHKTAPDAAILITADHGMNHKSQAWDLQVALKDAHLPVKIVISPEKDKYLKHHKGLGGSAYVYLNKPVDAEKVKKYISGLKGIDAVLTKTEAASRYHLMPGRIGDLMVLGDINTVFGTLNGKAYEQLPDNYRSHGSAYEAEVPLFVFNANSAPPAKYFNANYKLPAWLFADK